MFVAEKRNANAIAYAKKKNKRPTVSFFSCYHCFCACLRNYTSRMKMQHSPWNINCD